MLDSTRKGPGAWEQVLPSRPLLSPVTYSPIGQPSSSKVSTNSQKSISSWGLLGPKWEPKHQNNSPDSAQVGLWPRKQDYWWINKSLWSAFLRNSWSRILFVTFLISPYSWLPPINGASSSLLAHTCNTYQSPTVAPRPFWPGKLHHIYSNSRLFQLADSLPGSCPSLGDWQAFPCLLLLSLPPEIAMAATIWIFFLSAS